MAISRNSVTIKYQNKSSKQLTDETSRTPNILRIWSGRYLRPRTPYSLQDLEKAMVVAYRESSDGFLSV